MTELTRFRGGWMACRFVSVTVTADAGAVGLYYIAVIERLYKLTPITGYMARLTNVRSEGMRGFLFRGGVATGTDTIGL